MDTLVLSSAYQPLRQVTWQDAIGDIISGRVEIIETYTNRFITGANGSLPMPAVVRFVGHVIKRFVNKAPQFNKKNIWLRDGGICQYCSDVVGMLSFEMEHVIPKSHGGARTWKNIVASCRSCNRKKSNRTPKQAGMKLISQPYKPTFLNVKTSFDKKKGIPEAWKAYL
jgi:5-methylcytosine-specific restriction endonuclease McrA